MWISSFNGTRLKKVKQSAISGHVLQCNYAINFDDFDTYPTDFNKLITTKGEFINKTSNLKQTIKLFLFETFD